MAQKGNPVTSTQQFGYDAVGNRSSKTVDSQLTNYTYPASSNQLSALTGVGAKSYTYDGAGNPTLIGAASYVYNLANRLVAVTAVATYQVNALGQRVEKVAGGVTTRFVYDEQGHLVGEYDVTGTLIQETVWLEDLPIATLRPTGSGTPPPIAIYYVHPDHLGSPRAVTRPSDNAFLWRWDNVDPFGANLPNENPSGAGTFQYALRFPGQYYDAETSTHYNYFRDYDPTIGRYTESDPTGLSGGINTYGYGLANPIRNIDPTGEVAIVLAPALTGVAEACIAAISGLLLASNLTGDTPDEGSAARQREYEAYKQACSGLGQPPPGLSRCAELAWLYQKTKRCVELRQAWDDKWSPGRHSTEIRNLTQRLSNLAAAIMRDCCPDCAPPPASGSRQPR